MQEQQPNDRPWYLAAKLLTSGLDAREQKEWETLKVTDPEFLEEFEKVKTYWEKYDQLPYDAINIEKDWERVRQKIVRRKSTQKKLVVAGWMKYAAILAMFLLSAFLLWQYTDLFVQDTKMVLTSIQAPKGSKSFVTLPDGTEVWLNANSKISFSNHFGTDNRHIELEGEGFFDVVKNTLPFMVHTQQYDVAVLGTAFNIKAYPDDDQFTTTLVRGSLQVKNIKKSNEEFLLKPNEKLIMQVSSGAKPNIITLEKEIDADLETSWKDGWLVVKGETLEVLAKKIERLYDINIEFQDDSLKTYRYTGRIQQLSLEQVFKALSLTSPVAYTIREKTVILRENKSQKSKYRSLQNP